MSQPAPDAASISPPGLLKRRWAIYAAIAIVAGLAITGFPEDFADGLVVAALIYWVWGALRRALWRPGWFTLETAVLLGFGAVTLVTPSMDEDLGRTSWRPDGSPRLLGRRPLPSQQDRPAMVGGDVLRRRPPRPSRPAALAVGIDRPGSFFAMQSETFDAIVDDTVWDKTSAGGGSSSASAGSR